MKVTEQIPKSPRELEIFYRDSIEKLKNTDETLESLSNQVNEESMIRDFSHEIRVVSERVDTVEMQIEAAQHTDAKIRLLTERIDTLEQEVMSFCGLIQELRRMKDNIETIQNELTSEA